MQLLASKMASVVTIVVCTQELLSQVLKHSQSPFVVLLVVNVTQDTIHAEEQKFLSSNNHGRVIAWKTSLIKELDYLLDR